jgi:hypothetical protein
MGKFLMGIGGTLVVLGGIIWLIPKIPLLDRLGHLPGDIRIERPGFTCLVPLASSIIISILLTILLNIIARMINR